MLDELSREAHLKALGLPDNGVQYVVRVASSDPAKKVGRYRIRNWVLDFPSDKMGCMLQAESFGGEYQFLLRLEHRADVREILDQPETVVVQITDKAGRATTTTTTPDYLTVEDCVVVAYEVKSEQQLAQLTKERPDDWIRQGEQYAYIPAQRAFARLGIEHRVVSCGSLGAVYGDNLRTLAAVRKKPDDPALMRIRARVLAVLRYEGCMRIGNILDRLELVDATPVLQLISAGKAFADLDRVLLSYPRNIWISTSFEEAQALTGAEIDLVGALWNAQGTHANGIPDSRYQAEILRRHALARGKIQALEADRRSDRSIRRYKKHLREAGGDITALEPKWGNCGNDNPRIGVLHRAFIAASIKRTFSESAASSIRGARRDYLNNFPAFAAENDLLHERPVSLTTFHKYARLRETSSEIDDAQGGRRRRNAGSEPVEPSARAIVATRPFAAAHIDHCCLKIYVVVGWLNGKPVVRRPWLTLMVDAFTKEVIGMWLGLSTPSRKACAMVARDCVRRHARLPEILIVDGGKEFDSNHFLIMLAACRVTRMQRPPEDPRFGKEVERLFGLVKERLLRQLPAGFELIAKARAVSAAFQAHRRAKLRPEDLLEVLEHFLFEGYNNAPLDGELSSPCALRERREQELSCGGVRVKWDLKFLVASSIDAPTEAYAITPRKGVRVYGRWYYSDLLFAMMRYKKDIGVRLEPFDDSIVYVCVAGKWLVAATGIRRISSAQPFMDVMVRSVLRDDLRAQAKALALEADRQIAQMVSDKLADIARRSAKGTPSESAGKGSEQETRSAISFDDLQLLEETQ